jgi:hypothetical protein
MGPKRSQFFRMPAAERGYILALLAVSVVSFLPWWRDPKLGGLAVFGWLMATLMVLSPTLALLLFARDRRRRRSGRRGSP